MALRRKRHCSTSLIFLFVVAFGAMFGAFCFTSSADGKVDPASTPAGTFTMPNEKSEKSPVEPNITAAEVDPNDKPTIWRDARILITLVNGSEKVQIDSLSLAIPPRLGLSPKPTSKEGSDYFVIDKPTAMEPGTQVTFPIEMAAQPFQAVRRNFASILTYTSRREFFQAKLVYKSLETPDQPQHIKTADVTVEF